jgi:HEPN domain-containing protein
MDIALDAEIIYDNGDFLANLVAETREYINEHNIIRDGDSWSFPVKEHVATTLSEVTNKEWALAWLADGKRNLLAASHLLDAELFEKSVYHCQQAVEKGIKAILAAWGKFRRSHIVADILGAESDKQDLGEWKEKIMEIVDIGNTIEPHVSLSRYPELANGTIRIPHKEYDAAIAMEYLKKAKIVMKTSEEFIQWWFGVISS